MSEEILDPKNEITIPQDKVEHLQSELTNIREELEDNKYIQEAIKVLAAGGLRSTIGNYWNAVVDDLRRKVIHRSLDLFNKEMGYNGKVKTYEDFQTYVVDFDLIEGAFKIGVLNWEAKKLLHQARETRNIFDGHPDSSDPTLFKVFNMVADCNRYVLSKDFPQTIIDTNEYILQMDSTDYHKNEIAAEQAFTDLPEIYKNELANKLYTLYQQDNTSTILNSNIEFCYPILWKVLPKETRQQIGKRFDKDVVSGNKTKIGKALDLLIFVSGMRYTSLTSRKIIFEPGIKFLEDNLDNWEAEGRAAKHLKRLGTVIPDELKERYVSAITKTYVGYSGYYSFNASPIIAELFGTFDNNLIEAFVELVKKDATLKRRIRSSNKQLGRLQNLGNILLSETTIRDDLKEFIELMTDNTKTDEFFKKIK